MSDGDECQLGGCMRHVLEARIAILEARLLAQSEKLHRLEWENELLRERLEEFRALLDEEDTV